MKKAKKGKVVCPHCDKRFLTVKAKDNHYKTVHLRVPLKRYK